MEFITDFLDSINIYKHDPFVHRVDAWRNKLPNHEDPYMPYLYRYHVDAFINGSYSVISPFDGKATSSTFTVITRGSGHIHGKRGNTGLFILWGFKDSSGNSFLLGTMDVFSWFTHFLCPYHNIAHTLVESNVDGWFDIPMSLASLNDFLNPKIHSIIQDMSPLRKLLIGSSESLGHAVWNDLSGLTSYSMIAASNGLELFGLKTSSSILSSSLSSDSIIRLGCAVNNSYLRLDTIGDCKISFVPSTVFKPLDFVIRPRKLIQIFSTYHNKNAYSNKDPDIHRSHNKCALWLNIRSPRESKRAVWQNYTESALTTIKLLTMQLGYDEVTVYIDGWTGVPQVSDEYTVRCYEEHLQIASAIIYDLRNYCSRCESLVGETIDKKFAAIYRAKRSRCLSLCQYGSGTIFGSVIANDMAIVADPTVMREIGSGFDALLGRSDIVEGNCLRLCCVKTSPSLDSCLSSTAYFQTITEISQSCESVSDFYTIDDVSIKDYVLWCAQADKSSFKYVENTNF